MAITVTPTVNRIDGTKQVMFSQDAAGATDTLVADPGDGYRVVVISFLASMDAAGTFALKSATNALTGDITLATGVPWGWRGTLRQPFVECNNSEALILRTVTGAAKGVLTYKIVTSSMA